MTLGRIVSLISFEVADRTKKFNEERRTKKTAKADDMSRQIQEVPQPTSRPALVYDQQQYQYPAATIPYQQPISQPQASNQDRFWQDYHNTRSQYPGYTSPPIAQPVPTHPQPAAQMQPSLNPTYPPPQPRFSTPPTCNTPPPRYQTPDDVTGGYSPISSMQYARSPSPDLDANEKAENPFEHYESYEPRPYKA